VSARVRLRHFTDPACPSAFSAERQRHRLLWVYGDQIEWELHMVVLAGEPDYDMDMRRLSRSLHGLAARYGMPIDWRERRYAAASVHACRAVVAVGLRWPSRQDAYLRALRVLAMSGELLDDSDTLEIAAERAGLPVAELAAYADAPEVHAALAEDMAAARRPSPAALAQADRLAGPPEQRRYTCPSYELERLGPPADGLPDIPRLDLPGFRPIEAYVAALANLAPELDRREDPESPLEVLDWAPYALATAEIAAVCDAEVDDTRAFLARTGARFTPAGGDGYWSCGAAIALAARD
jgi:predicted DsbA family dithiol-disulfide isomerase